MSEDTALVAKHVAALVAEAEGAGIPSDLLGRLLVHEAIEIWKRDRSWQDVASELTFLAENLDPDTDHEFMRP